MTDDVEMMTDPSLDVRCLTDPDFFANGDPYRLWRHLRERAPVVWTPDPAGPGFWSVTRYDDCVRVLKDGVAFSVRAGTTLEADRWHDDPASDKMLALMDAPRHTQLRRILAPYFSQRRALDWEQSVRDKVRLLLQRASEMRTFDFVSEVGSKLPATLFRSLMAISPDDWRRFAGVIERTLSVCEIERGIADGEMLVFLSDLTAERRRHPGEDLLSAIATARIDDRLLDDDEVVLSIANVLSASVQTLRLASSGGVEALAAHPDQWARLRGDPVGVPAAVEEILRWTTPPLATTRTAVRDTLIGCQPVACGERVAVWLPSANRDPGLFAEAERFDISRVQAQGRHFAFGVGMHACLGAVFARLVLRVLFEEMSGQWLDIAQSGRAQRLHSLVLHGFDSLPVQVTVEA